MNYEKMTKAELIRLLNEFGDMQHLEKLQKDLEVANRGVRAKDNIIIELKDKITKLEDKLKTLEFEITTRIEKENHVKMNTLSEQVRTYEKHIEVLKEEYNHLTNGIFEFDFLVNSLNEVKLLNDKIINNFVGITKNRYLQVNEKPNKEE